MDNFMVKIFILIICIACVLVNSFDVSEHDRSKRSLLLFPRTSPTRIQLITGIGIPVDLEMESVTIGWVNKVQYFLPENTSNYLNFLNDPFDLTTRLSYACCRKKRQTDDNDEPTELPNLNNEDENELNDGFDEQKNEKFERHRVEAEVIESGNEDDLNEDDMTEADYWNQEQNNVEWYEKTRSPKKPKNLAKSRWQTYKTIALMAHSKGLDGRMCVLRSICESAHTSFDYSNGILGELMHILMTPSLTKDEIEEYSDYEYYHAEKLGKEGAPCEQIFNECTTSILDMFGGIYTPIFDGI